MDRYVYIDEFGTPDLEVNKDGVLPYFVYAALVIDGENNVAKAREILNDIHSNHFHQNHYLKSSSNYLSDKKHGYGRTVDILTLLKKLEHFVYAIVIDKSMITSKGLSYKNVFIKYFQRIIAQHLNKEHDDNIHICFDKTGYQEFQDELKRYMSDNYVQRSLFSEKKFILSDDKTEEPLLQIADFYAGIIGKYYCERFDDKKREVLHTIFREKVYLEWFPHDTVPPFAKEDAFNQAYNDEITKIAARSAEKYLETKTNDREGCELIRYILQEAQVNKSRCISSKEIRAKLLSSGIDVGDPIVKISELRDNGVLIISPIGKKGYKLPNSEQEIAEFYNRLIGNVMPQLKRCRILNAKLLEESGGRYNILKSDNFKKLDKLCDIVSEN